MTEQKGLASEAADLIGNYVKLSGGAELCDILSSDSRLSANKAAMQGIEDMRLLFKYLEVLGVTNAIKFDLSLARGLDYYTGVIYEAVFNSPPPSGMKFSF
jgi:histidyl-tRNA synthetase